MSETDVLKMKVADLKRELKLRGLPITGNKTDLQERLQSALLDGDLTLDDTAICEDALLDDDVLTDEEVPVSPIPEENSTAASIPERKTEPISTTVNLTETKINISENSQPKKPVVLKRKPITLSNSTDNLTTGSTNISTSPISNDQLPPEKLPKLDTNSEENLDIQDQQGNGKKIVKINQLSLKERMEMRAKKFGTPLTQPSTLNNLESKNKSITNEKIDISDPKTIEALKKRAERFGVITAPQISAIERAEKLQKRKERFGLTNDTNKAAISKVTSTNSDYAEKAKLRLERFKTAVSN